MYENIADKIRSIPIIANHPSLKQLIKYSLVGNISNFIDFGLYIFLTRVFNFWFEHYLITNLITMFLASVVRFLFHKHWTFRDGNKKVHEQYLKFTVTIFLGFIVNEVVLIASVELASINDLIGKLLAMLIASFCSFGVNKKWVFKPELPKIIERFRQWKKIKAYKRSQIYKRNHH